MICLSNRRPYRVTVTVKQYDSGRCYSSDKYGEYKTWAVSEAQAINNIRYREGLKDSDGYGDYAREYVFKAVQI